MSNCKLFRNPLVWIARFRHRRGYGVHSPFAFNFITGVVYERSSYYAYEELAALHPWWVRWFRLRPLQCCRLLFRLANFAEAHKACLVGVGRTEYKYVRAAATRAKIYECLSCVSATPADFVLVASAQAANAPTVAGRMGEHAMLVVEGIHDSDVNRLAWKQIQSDGHTGVTFDLYDYGIAFFNHSLTKQHYIVNF